MTARVSGQLARIVGIGFGVAVLGYGLYIVEPGAPRLMAFGLTLFALPLLFQFTPWPLARAYALWFGAFLVLQSVMSPLLLGDTAYLVSHTPNMTRILTYPEGSDPGITAPQRITTDERGYRVTPRVNYERKVGIRIVAIGGSTTEEMGLDDEATWTHRVQVALAKELGQTIEVINTGVSGLRTRHHIATLRRILPLQPDLVLFLVGINDWHFDTYTRFGSFRIVDRQRFPDTVLGRVARTQYGRLFSPPPVPRVETATAIVDPLRLRSLEREPKISWFPETASEQYLGNLERISAICRQNDLTCVFLTQPNAYAEGASQDIKDLFWMTPSNAPYTLTFESLVHLARLYNRALIDFAIQHHHPFCDVAAQVGPTTEYFTDEVHFTIAGAARVAEIVTPCLVPLMAKGPAVSPPD
jgi:lysophospholipase L1-like esterase